MNYSAYTGAANAPNSPLDRLRHRVRGWFHDHPMEAEDNAHLNERLLRLCVTARVIVSGAGLAIVADHVAHFAMPVPWLTIAAILFVLALVSFAGIARIRGGAPATETDLMLQIICDVLVLTVVLSLDSDRDTAFDHLFLLPVVLGAYALTGWRITLVVALVVLGWFISEGFGSSSRDPLEVIANLAIGALVSYFAYAVARLSRRHERFVAGNRERAINVLGAEARGMVAARAAHTLSTPLGTIAVVVADLRQGRIPPAEQDAALETLAAEIATCKLHLSGLLESEGVDRGEGGYRANVVQVLTEMREECLLSYPSGHVKLSWPEESVDPPDIVIELSLFNALAGLMKDFIRDDPHVAHVSAAWDAEDVVIRLGGARKSDSQDEADAKADVPFRGRRRERLAVVAAIVDRHGGTVVVEPGGGRRITIRLPHADHQADMGE